MRKVGPELDSVVHASLLRSFKHVEYLEMSMTATEAAIKSYQNDARFRFMVDSIVSRAIHDHGPVDPERADRAAHDIAKKACVLLLQGIYDDDAELNNLRVERDHYKSLALRTADMTPPTWIIPRDTAPNR